MNFFISFNIIFIIFLIIFIKKIIEDDYGTLDFIKLVFCLIILIVTLGFIIDGRMNGIILKIILLENFKVI